MPAYSQSPSPPDLGLLFPSGRFVGVHSLGPEPVGRFQYGIVDPAFTRQQFSARPGAGDTIIVQCQGPNRAPLNPIPPSDLLV
jgi:hypothetical protein